VNDVDRQTLLAAIAHFETHSRPKLVSAVEQANARPGFGFHFTLKEEESPTIQAGGGIPAPLRPFITITAGPKPAKRSIVHSLAGTSPTPDHQGPNIQISMTADGHIIVQPYGGLNLTPRGPFSPPDQFDGHIVDLIGDFVSALGP
jgi:hypothetical protein